MTFKFKNAYIENTSLIAGYYEKLSPYAKYFDKIYEKDFYFKEKSLEQAETKLLSESIDLLLKKAKKTKDEIDVIIAGDLLNQITSSSYAILNKNIPFLGVYSACATSNESIIIASAMIDTKHIGNAICSTSSHNLTSEKQFRNPIEYGGPKPKTATFTATGGASILITSKKTDIKIESGTIGKIMDLGVKDANNMGAVMAPAAADTIARHLFDLGRDINYYDLILTGDLGIFGKEILKEFIKKDYNIILDSRYDDCGAMLYNLEKQKEITAGGSGPVCAPLINYGFVYQMLKSKHFKKVLLVTTGALFSPTFLYQKNNILSIAHAISLEVVEK